MPLDAEVVSQLEYKARVEDQQLRVAFVALRVEVERIGVLQVFTLISFPCIDVVIVHKQREIAEAREDHLGLGLEAESRSHVIVAVDHVVVVALRTAEQDEIGKDRLFQPLEITHLRELPHHAGTEGSCF